MESTIVIKIVKHLWAYIRKHNLQDPGNKRKIICNDELRLVFETDCTDMFKMNKLLSKHISPLEPTKPPKKPKMVVEPGTKSSESGGPVVMISEALANFFGIAGREMLHSEVLRRVWEYVTVNHLEVGKAGGEKWKPMSESGGFRQISWFQFLPHESDLNPLPDKSTKLEQKMLLLYWTNSFVGPSDPSQGVHNPDEKIKLWLFLPGRYASVIEFAQAAVSRLRVVASGVWLAPGDSEEVASILSQALRNRIERALNGLSYMRFGDAFSKYQPFPQSEELFRFKRRAIGCMTWCMWKRGLLKANMT